jgi:predicted glutamine amidotransferase
LPNLLAMTFEGALAPSFDLKCLRPGRTLPDGWGIGYYPGGEPVATVLKEPAPPVGSIRSTLVKAWEHLESSLFVVHIRTATWGAPTDANTQPFCRAWGRRDWLMAHSGSLRERPAPPPQPFEPIGSTDTEAVLCGLLGRIAERGWSSIAESDPNALLGWMASLNELGSLTSVLTDGKDLLVYADRDPADRGIWVREVLPPYDVLRLADTDLEVDLTLRGPKSRKGVVVSSEPMEVEGEQRGAWRRVPPGALLVVRQGAVILEQLAPNPAPSPGLGVALARRMVQPLQAPVQRFEVVHRTA